VSDLEQTTILRRSHRRENAQCESGTWTLLYVPFERI
jgi:hypothetical protein